MTPQQKAKFDALAEPAELSALREENRKLREALISIESLGTTGLIQDGGSFVAAMARVALTPSGEAPKHTDKERLDFWFGIEAKRIDAEDFMRGVREGWSLERWRQFIDSAIDAAKEKA